MALFFASCNIGNKPVDEFLCTAEKFDSDTILVDENNPHIYFHGLNLLDNTISKSGQNSLKVDSINLFAFTTKVNIHSDFMYQLSFWQYGGDEKVFAVVQSDSTFYLRSSTIVEKDSSGWNKISLIFSISDKFKNKKFSFYIWNAGGKTAYVDDFQLKPYLLRDLGMADTLFWIYLDEPELNNIKEQREFALEQGILSTDDDSWVKGIVLYGDDNYKIKMRLKGDWLDHLAGQKWSFRIKIRNDKSFRGMKVFSIQNPSVRFYLNQWFLYTLFRSEDLLAPRYGFVYGQMNDNFLGLYAFEEHFQKQLIESAKRREGPILKFTEDSFWDLIIEHEKNEKWYNYPLYEASKIVPFGENKIIENSTLREEYNIAQNLLFQYKWGLTKISDLFDVEKTAKWYALTDVMQGYHGLRWHNQRYYYNPVTSKLELIAYDNFVGEGFFHLTDSIFFGYFNPDISSLKPEFIPNYYLFQDTVFLNYYLFYLDKYSQKNYWDSVFNYYEDEISYYQSILLKEFPDSQFDKDIFYTHSQQIQEVLPIFKEKIENGLYSSILLPNSKPDKFNEEANPNFIKDYVNIYTQSSSFGVTNLRIVNFYLADLEAVKYGNSKGIFSIKPEKVNSFVSNDYKKDVNISDDVDFIVVSDGKNKVEIPVMKWPEPTAWSPRQELEQNNKFPNQNYYEIAGSNVIFSGKQTINEIVVIPQYFNVIFEAATEIDFIEGGGFLSYSAVYINGTKNKPVKIISSDKSARGFTVLQAGKVEMDYAVFDGLNTFNYKGWGLTGAVTIYECESRINNCEFINNECEDDLNIVRSNFDVSNSLFFNSFSDAFDSDFCTGKVTNCKFENLGNDAIDFSTSEIEIVGCDIFNASDKAVSGGEASHLIIRDCNIDRGNIGFASKDKSVLTISNTSISNVTYVLAAFQKKPEYGPAKIFADNLKADNFIQMSLIEENSTFILDGLKIEGKHKDVASLFY
ncbi:MAG: hypothetical protein JXL97_17930 [Bacteroidales bacterium]|nr:hypothetical protein [Bacteroidales bacterium]